MSASLDALIPELVPFARALVDAAGAAGLQPRITSTLRTRSEQRRLYDRYLAGTATLPVAPPGRSAHEYGYAFDMVVTPFDALRDVGAFWESQGGVWGGDFNDPVHFEYPGFTPPAAGGLATVSDFLLNLPWYIQILIPASLSYSSNEQITQWLRDRGFI